MITPDKKLRLFSAADILRSIHVAILHAFGSCSGTKFYFYQRFILDIKILNPRNFQNLFSTLLHRNKQVEHNFAKNVFG